MPLPKRTSYSRLVLWRAFVLSLGLTALHPLVAQAQENNQSDGTGSVALVDNLGGGVDPGTGPGGLDLEQTALVAHSRGHRAVREEPQLVTLRRRPASCPTSPPFGCASLRASLAGTFRPGGLRVSRRSGASSRAGWPLPSRLPLRGRRPSAAGSARGSCG